MLERGEGKEETNMEIYIWKSSSVIVLSKPPQNLPNSLWGCSVILREARLEGIVQEEKARPLLPSSGELEILQVFLQSWEFISPLPAR